MEHDEAVRTNATERYLLGELEPDLRDQYEEHLFDCQDCALDLRAAATFLEHSKVVLATPEAAPARGAVPVPKKPGWLSWLRPAIAAPALAALLAVIAYQNFLPGPTHGTRADAPLVLPSVSLITANTRGGATPSVTIGKRTPFLVFVDVPDDDRFVSYSAELHDPAGTKQWSLPVSAGTVKETVSLQIPPVHSGTGTYTLVVLGVKSGGGTAEVGQYPFHVDVH